MVICKSNGGRITWWPIKYPGLKKKCTALYYNTIPGLKYCICKLIIQPGDCTQPLWEDHCGRSPATTSFVRQHGTWMNQKVRSPHSVINAPIVDILLTAWSSLNNCMKFTITLLTAVIFTTLAHAGHSQGNGTCTDDLIHYQNMENKRTDAPLFDQSQGWRNKAVEMRVTGDTATCEEYLEEALRMIRKTDGEYPTE